MSNLPHHRLRGYALVELIAVIAVSGVVGTAAAMLLGTLLAADRGGRRHLYESSSLSRLAQQFRADVAAADAAALEPAPPTQDESPAQSRPQLKLSSAGGAIIYASESGRIVRRQEGPTQTARRESYALTEFAAANFEIEPGPSQTLARFILEGGEEAGWRIEGAVGRDRKRAARLSRVAEAPQDDREERP